MSELWHLNRRGSSYQHKHKKDRGGAYPLVVAGMMLVAIYGVLNPDKMPRPVQEVVGAYRNIGRDHAPTPGPYYTNCDEARAAGVAPTYAGEPGYRDRLDGDSDGIACEPYRG